MKENELAYYFPYRIEKQYHFRNKLQDINAFYDEMEGKYEYFYENDANYGHRRNRNHLSLLQCSINDYIVHDLFYNWHTWFKNGRNIFSFSGELLEMLNHTDVEDVTYDSFQLPYDNFYLSLRPLGLKISKDSEKIIEGVYVSIDRKAMEKQEDDFWFDYAIEFNFVGDFEEKIIQYHDKIWNEHGSGGHGYWNYAFYFREKNNVITVADALREWQEIELHELFQVDEEEKITDAHLDIYNCYKDLVDTTYKVVINCLLYLSQHKADKDIESHYPIDLPLNLNKKMQLARNEKEKLKVKKKLAEIGFSKINYVGNTYRKSYKEIGPGSNETSPHWRRGHWRNQRFGEKLTERKLIWIKPVIVNKNIGVPQKGHIYGIAND
ncbi:MAG: hypothetical protein ACWA6U_16710 [Breznakibacter sp.]